MYLPFDQDWNDLERSLFESDLDKRWPVAQNAVTIQIITWTIIKVKPGPLARYCTHQETIGGTLEQKYLPSDQDWLAWRGGHYSSRTRINAGGNKAATIRVISWTIIEVRPVALGQTMHPPGDHLNRSTDPR